MRKVLLASAGIAFASIAATSAAQTPAASDPLAIGGKDTAWFMDRVGRPDTDSEPQAPFKIMGNVYYVGANNIASILVVTPLGHILIDTGTSRSASRLDPRATRTAIFLPLAVLFLDLGTPMWLALTCSERQGFWRAYDGR